KQLPLGPIHLVGQDVVIMGVAVALAWPMHHARAFWCLKAFFTVYLLSLAAMLWCTKEKLCAFAVWFGLGAMIHTWVNLPAFVAVTGCTYGLGYWGLRQSLARFRANWL